MADATGYVDLAAPQLNSVQCTKPRSGEIYVAKCVSAGTAMSSDQRPAAGAVFACGKRAATTGVPCEQRDGRTSAIAIGEMGLRRLRGSG